MGYSIWNNVAFDPTAASNAIGALSLAADELDQANAARTAAGNQAQLDWSGATQVEFTQNFNAAMRQAADLVVALKRATGTIQQAITDADNEQKRRMHARSLYPRGPMRPE